MKRLSLIYFILLSIQPFNCNTIDIKNNSARLDKIIIPIMYNVSNHDFGQAYNASILLMDEWDMYKNIAFGKTEVSIKEMEQSISSLPIAINLQQEEKALEIIKDIQCSLSEWRREQDVDYYLDDWFQFKNNVDEFASISEDILLDLCEWEELEWRFENINADFYFLNVYPYDLEYFDINKNVFQQQLFNINTSIMDLNVAMESAERENVERQAFILKTNVRHTIYMFANFQESYAGI